MKRKTSIPIVVTHRKKKKRYLIVDFDSLVIAVHFLDFEQRWELMVGNILLYKALTQPRPRIVEIILDVKEGILKKSNVSTLKKYRDEEISMSPLFLKYMERGKYVRLNCPNDPPPADIVAFHIEIGYGSYSRQEKSKAVQAHNFLNLIWSHRNTGYKLNVLEGNMGRDFKNLSKAFSCLKFECVALKNAYKRDMMNIPDLLNTDCVSVDSLTQYGTNPFLWLNKPNSQKDANDKTESISRLLFYLNHPTYYDHDKEIIHHVNRVKEMFLSDGVPKAFDVVISGKFAEPMGPWKNEKTNEILSINRLLYDGKEMTWFRRRPAANCEQEQLNTDRKAIVKRIKKCVETQGKVSIKRTLLPSPYVVVTI